ncbi:MAG: hypothetical protein AMXMBFR84_37920 [Candidatus Hydrogenedentota bacterium]
MLEADNAKRYLPVSKTCFVCGEENPFGLKLRFRVDGNRIWTSFDPVPAYCGFPNVLHGGVAAALLDETMGWAANRSLSRMTLTGELRVRYVRPVPGDRVLHVWAEVSKGHRRIAYTHGAITSEDGAETYARAEARFIPLSLEETVRIDEHLVYRGNEERVFDRARAEMADGLDNV